MLFLAAAAASVAMTTPSPDRRAAVPLVQAQATVRILSGVRLQLGKTNAVAGQRLRVTNVSTSDGVRPAKLVEFE